MQSQGMQAVAQSANAGRSGSGVKKAARMRFKSHNSTIQTSRLSMRFESINQRLMAPMYPIKISNRQSSIDRRGR